MASFERARAVGADGIEFDVHRTADGAFVVIHDFSLERTTNGTGLVSHHTLDAITSLDAGSWYSADYAGERIPSLEQVLALDGLEFELEIKVFEARDLAALVDQVSAAGVLDRVEFTSPNAPMLMALKESTPRARIGVFSPRRADWMEDEIFQSFVTSAAGFAGADVVHVHAQDITAAVVDALHAKGHVVHAKDSATRADIANAVNAGADRTTTNDPGTARHHLP